MTLQSEDKFHRFFRENFGKIYLDWKITFPAAAIVFVGVKIVRQSNLSFLNNFLIYLNLVVWISNWCHLCEISMKFVSFLGPMEAIYSFWILSSGLIFAHKQRDFNSKHNDSCFHHLQTLFWKREPCPTTIFTLFFLLTDTFCLFGCIKLFPYCSRSESDCLISQLLPILFCLDSFCQLLGSYGGHLLILDPFKWVNFRPQTERLQLDTQGLLFPSSANIVLEEGALSDNYIYSFFSFWPTLFVFLVVLNFFHIVPDRSLTVWFLICCQFCFDSILFVSCWGPMEAMFSSWILSSGLNFARELRASIWNIRTAVSIICKLGLLKAMSENLIYFFKSFRLASWGGRKLDTFADKAERQRWKSYRRIFAKTVAIRNPLSFF